MILPKEVAMSMAQAVLERTNCKEVEQLAMAVAASQQAEIRQMQELLQSRGTPVEGEFKRSQPTDSVRLPADPLGASSQNSGSSPSGYHSIRVRLLSIYQPSYELPRPRSALPYTCFPPKNQ